MVAIIRNTSDNIAMPLLYNVLPGLQMIGEMSCVDYKIMEFAVILNDKNVEFADFGSYKNCDFAGKDSLEYLTGKILLVIGHRL